MQTLLYSGLQVEYSSIRFMKFFRTSLMSCGRWTESMLRVSLRAANFTHMLMYHLFWNFLSYNIP